jgi:phage terminase large subunit-like protein
LSDNPDVTDPTSPADAGFEALWQRVLEDWDDDKPHAALIEFALRTEQLPEAASRYRALKNDPAKAERAQKRLDAIVVAATALMMSMKTPPRTKVPLPITLSAFGIFLFALCFVVYMFMHH